MKSVLKELNKLAEKKTGTNPKKKDIGDTINYMSENMTGTDPKEKTVAKALKYYVDNYVSGGGGSLVLDGTVRFGSSSFETFPSWLENASGWENYTDTAQMFRGNRITTIPLINTSNVTNMNAMFQNCLSLTTIPLINTSNVTDMTSMFQSTTLIDLPLLDTSNVKRMYNMFNGVRGLTDESLDNILQMCINAIPYEEEKTLYYLGFRSSTYPVTRMESLPHYQDFLNAGWTLGY